MAKTISTMYFFFVEYHSKPYFIANWYIAVLRKATVFGSGIVFAVIKVRRTIAHMSDSGLDFSYVSHVGTISIRAIVLNLAMHR